MSDEQKRLLEKQLWAVANVLRGKMNADEYKNYILGFIFYKYLSEKLVRYVDEKLLAREDFKFAEIKENSKEGKEYIEHIRESCIDHLGFFLRPTQLFSYLVNKGKGNVKGEEAFILEDLKNILNSIEQTSMGTASEDDFKGLFDDVDLTSSKLGSTEQKKNAVIVDVLAHLNGIDFKLEDSKSDLLGDAYEYLIGEFAAGAGKKGGEFYTPAQVSRLLAQIVTLDKKRIKSVYDAACGSGSLLLRLKDYAEVNSYYGQELNPTTYNLARMNMILHGVHFDHFKIKQGDTLTEDMLPDLKAEAIVANPPFSAKWKGDTDPQLVHDDRFTQYGRLAPKGAADYAFVTHMLHHLADNGTMAVVLPHGALYRGGVEKQIRKYLVKNLNYLDAVIGLPENIFFGTDMATCILVFKKCRKESDDVLFVDGSSCFGRGNKQNHLRDEDLSKLFNVYKERAVIDKFSYRAPLKEIEDNEYFFNIARYVSALKEEGEIDLSLVSNSIREIGNKLDQVDKEIAALCASLDIPAPHKGFVSSDIFSGKIRFKNDDGELFPEWKSVKLKELLTENKTKNTAGKFDEVFSVAKEKGVINQIEHLGRSYASENITNYKVVFPNDVVYTKSPTAGFPFGIIKQNKTERTGVVSVLYAVFKPINSDVGLLLDYYFSSEVNTYNYLKPIVNLGAKNTINLNNDAFLNGKRIRFPVAQEEVVKINKFLSLIDKKFELLTNQGELIREYKKGSMQALFGQAT